MMPHSRPQGRRMSEPFIKYEDLEGLDSEPPSPLPSSPAWGTPSTPFSSVRGVLLCATGFGGFGTFLCVFARKAGVGR